MFNVAWTSTSDQPNLELSSWSKMSSGKSGDSGGVSPIASIGNQKRSGLKK